VAVVDVAPESTLDVTAPALESEGVLETETVVVVASGVEDESVLPVDPTSGIWSANGT
jgi:hypothetical protein